MNTLALDSRFTFDTFVIGSGNRLATAAARRVGEAPGSTYNPLFLYSASGLGKTHLLMAIGHAVSRIHPDLAILYDTLEHLMDEVMAAIEAGERDAFRTRIAGVGLLLLDDVQFLAGRHRTQEELLRAWDDLSARGGQVVLTSDRPPTEIDGLDERLLSRFSGGLIVDIGAPDFETRVAILRRKAQEREQTLGPGVAEALARLAFANVRELQGALNRLLAVQELEGRAVAAEEVRKLFGRRVVASPPANEFGDFLAEITGAVDAAIAAPTPEQRLADTILRWEGEGYRTRRLEAALADAGPGTDVDAVTRAFEADVARLRDIVEEIELLDAGAPELERLDILRDPDRLPEADTLLAQVRERMQPLPSPPPGPDLSSLRLPADSFPVRAAAAAAEQPGTRYNPFFVHGGEAADRTALLAALGRRILEHRPELPLAFVGGADFAGELIHALERNLVEGWRARYRRVRVLLLDGVDALAETERAQDELFHLFDSLQRAGAQLAFSAELSPGELDGIEARLRTRLGSGLVLELPDRTADPEPAEPPPESAAPRDDEWFRSREKVVWDWPYPADLLVEELD